jgi:ankyrin repeat protein
LENVIRLLRRGCDPFIKDSKGMTALDIAIINHPGSRLVEILRDYM